MEGQFRKKKKEILEKIDLLDKHREQNGMEAANRASRSRLDAQLA